MSLSAEPPDATDRSPDVQTATPPEHASHGDGGVRTLSADPPTPEGAPPDGEPIRALTATVEALSLQLAAKDQAIQQLQAQLHERDGAIQNLQQHQRSQAEAHERIELELRQHLLEALADKDARLDAEAPRIAELEAMVALRDQNITAREWETASLRSQVEEIEQRVEELDARLADIYASRTWLLSKKLWSARSRARKLIR